MRTRWWNRRISWLRYGVSSRSRKPPWSPTISADRSPRSCSPARQRTAWPVGLTQVVFLNSALYDGVSRPRPAQRLLANRRVGPLLARLVSEQLFGRNLAAVFSASHPLQPENAHALLDSVSTSKLGTAFASPVAVHRRTQAAPRALGVRARTHLHAAQLHVGYARPRLRRGGRGRHSKPSAACRAICARGRGTLPPARGARTARACAGGGARR